MGQKESLTSLTRNVIRSAGVNPFTIALEKNPALKNVLSSRWYDALRESRSMIPLIEDLTIFVENRIKNRSAQRASGEWETLLKDYNSSAKSDQSTSDKTLELTEETWPLLIRFREGFNSLLANVDKSNLPIALVVLHTYVGRLIDAKRGGAELPEVIIVDNTSLSLDSLPFSKEEQNSPTEEGQEELTIAVKMNELKESLTREKKSLQRSLGGDGNYSSKAMSILRYLRRENSFAREALMMDQSLGVESFSQTVTGKKLAEIFNENRDGFDPISLLNFWLEAGREPLLAQLLNFSIGSILEPEEESKPNEYDKHYESAVRLVEFIAQSLGGEKELDNDTVLFLEMLEEPILKKLGLFVFHYQMRDWDRLEYFQKGPGLVSQLTDYWKDLAQLTGKQHFLILADSLKVEETMLQTSDEEMVWREYMGNLEVDENADLAIPELAEAVHTRLQNRFVRTWLQGQNDMGVFNTQIGNINAEVFVKQDDMRVSIVTTLNDSDGRRAIVTLTPRFRLSLPERVILEFPDTVLWFEEQLLTSVYKFLGQIREFGKESYRQGLDRGWEDELVYQVFPEEREEEKREPVSESNPIIFWTKHSSSDLTGINSRDQQIIMNRLLTLGKGSGRTRMLKKGYGLRTRVPRLVVGKYRVAYRDVEGGRQILGVFLHGDNDAYVKELARRLA